MCLADAVIGISFIEVNVAERLEDHGVFKKPLYSTGGFVALHDRVEQGCGLSGAGVLRKLHEGLNPWNGWIEAPLVIDVFVFQEAMADRRKRNKVGVRKVGIAFIVLNDPRDADMQRVIENELAPDVPGGGHVAEVVAGAACGKHHAVGLGQRLGRVSGKPGVGEDIEVLPAGKDSSAVGLEVKRGAGGCYANVICVIAGNGFNAGYPHTEGFRSRGGDGFAIAFIDDAVAIVYPDSAADAIDAVTVGIRTVKAELIVNNVVDDQAGAKTQGQPPDVDAGIAFVTGEEAELVSEHSSGEMREGGDSIKYFQGI